MKVLIRQTGRSLIGRLFSLLPLLLWVCQRAAAAASVVPEAEPNGMMGKLDEGLDDFFSKKVIRRSFRWENQAEPVAGSNVTSCRRLNSSCSSRLSSAKAPPPGVQEAAEKKRDSRKSGFFNLLKSRTSRSEKSHGGGGANVVPPHHPSSPVSAESTPMSPPPGGRSPTVELQQEPPRAPGAEATPTVAETAEEQQEEAEEQRAEEVEDKVEAEEEKKENPHAPRHVGVPVMGLDLLAEMKARQERMAARKVGGASQGSKGFNISAAGFLKLCFVFLLQSEILLDKSDTDRGEHTHTRHNQSIFGLRPPSCSGQFCALTCANGDQCDN